MDPCQSTRLPWSCMYAGWWSGLCCDVTFTSSWVQVRFARTADHPGAHFHCGVECVSTEHSFSRVAAPPIPFCESGHRDPSPDLCHAGSSEKSHFWDGLLCGSATDDVSHNLQCLPPWRSVDSVSPCPENSPVATADDCLPRSARLQCVPMRQANRFCCRSLRRLGCCSQHGRYTTAQELAVSPQRAPVGFDSLCRSKEQAVQDYQTGSSTGRF